MTPTYTTTRPALVSAIREEYKILGLKPSPPVEGALVAATLDGFERAIARDRAREEAEQIRRYGREPAEYPLALAAVTTCWSSPRWIVENVKERLREARQMARG